MPAAPVPAVPAPQQVPVGRVPQQVPVARAPVPVHRAPVVPVATVLLRA
ncbi:hypothetical protein [Arthrobacter sp. DR-2P]|nr:hypothetical protein [Arthrobacter sp. DR-2P]